MTWRCSLVVVACAIACSSPPPKKKREGKRPKPSPYVIASDDRANPVRIRAHPQLSRFDGGSIRVDAPGAGTWWFAADIPRLPGKFSKVRFSATSNPPGVLTLAYVDERGDVLSATGMGSNDLNIELPETFETPSVFLLRVVTTRSVRFSLYTSRMWRDPDPVRHPDCDRNNIDPSNPNCAGVHPRCNLNFPDFKNPSCCQAACDFGRLSCRSRIIRVDQLHAWIEIGADKEIMLLARGTLYQRGKHGHQEPVSEVVVSHVGERESAISIFSPEKVDPSTLLENGTVVLSPPMECGGRR